MHPDFARRILPEFHIESISENEDDAVVIHERNENLSPHRKVFIQRKAFFDKLQTFPKERLKTSNIMESIIIV
jgi:hypothetical protein